MNTFTSPKNTRPRQTQSWQYYATATACCVVLVAGFFFAARQHFSSMEYGLQNSRLRRQLDELQSEKRKLLVIVVYFVLDKRAHLLACVLARGDVRKMMDDGRYLLVKTFLQEGNGFRSERVSEGCSAAGQIVETARQELADLSLKLFIADEVMKTLLDETYNFDERLIVHRVVNATR